MRWVDGGLTEVLRGGVVFLNPEFAVLNVVGVLGVIFGLLMKFTIASSGKSAKWVLCKLQY